MTNIVEQVKIDGFWGTKVVDLSFYRHLNFIIGVNGSGKTTFIDILSAALRIDLETLANSQFSKIEITLKSTNQNKKPRIIVEKDDKDEFTPNITYFLYEKSSDTIPLVYEFEDIPQNRLRSRRVRNPIQFHTTLHERISSLLNLKWLPILRTHSIQEFEYSDQSRDFVDLKLDNVLSGFTRYFSSMQARDQRQTDSFQEAIFLSLLHKATGFGEELRRSEEELETEREELAHIMAEFNVDAQKYTTLIDSHFRMLHAAMHKLSGSEGMKPVDIAAILDNNRLINLVDKWTSLKKERAEIYRTRENFIKIMNDRLSRKRLIINDRNDIFVETQSGKQFSPKFLSSGEKQLFILLGEALLCERKQVTYIADEPELSLHVTWQSDLVNSLIMLNPNLQIIFATHSPDIVGRHQDRIIEIEDYTK
jgi:predicted ATPase